VKFRQFGLLFAVLMICASFIGCEVSPTLPASRQTPIPTNTSKALPAIELKGKAFSPNGGTSLAAAKKLVIAELRKNGIQGDIESAIKVDEITTEVFWENNQAQLFSVNLDYAWVDGIAIVKGHQLLTILSSLEITGRYLADLDQDGHYEVYVSVSQGSGRIIPAILGYNPAKTGEYSFYGPFPGKEYEDVFYNLFLEDGKLLIRINDNIGELVLVSEKGKQVLGISPR